MRDRAEAKEKAAKE